ncbi:hypothetical protein [Marivirga harenae]|uniref:hypothetical protein n=1 Tax=Marivirga harenae TaxID=2010992 RepID=UPI0026E0806C|nr:hypothetical protein [Marivirga harenae]WKV12638.1 hypothetical protein Q3Y49_02165 [Marivirga harenae]
MKVFLTTLTLLWAMQALGQDIRTIQVVNIRDVPLKCKLYFNGQDMGYASNGEIDIPSECKFTDRLDIVPVDTETYEGRKNLPCYSVQNKIIIYSRGEKMAALKNAFFIDNCPEECLAEIDSPEKISIYGKAALASNEIYNLDIYADSVRKEARVNAIKYTASALNVEDGTYTENGYLVPNEKLLDALSQYQASKGLAVTKKIDVRTLQSLAKDNSFSVLTKDYNALLNYLIDKTE